jgi:hypothetical protein
MTTTRRCGAVATCLWQAPGDGARRSRKDQVCLCGKLHQEGQALILIPAGLYSRPGDPHHLLWQLSLERRTVPIECVTSGVGGAV